MAYQSNLQCVPGLVAASDLSSDQFKFVNNGATGVTLNATNGGACLGVLQDKPSAANQAASVAYDGVTKVVAGGSVTVGDRIMSDASGTAVTAASVATSATKTSSAGTFDLNAADTMVIDVDNAGNATATWDAAAATITDTTSYPVTDQDTKTMTVTITGGEWDAVVQTVTFSGATTTAATVAAGINAQVVGCRAEVSGGQVVLTTDGQGTDYDIATGAGTGDLTWGSSTAGTGDVGDINAVTTAEIKTVIEADTTATVTENADGTFTISSPTTGDTSELDFKSGNALTKCGLSVEVVTGSASDSHYRGIALESASSGEIFSMTLAPTGKY